MNFNFIYTLALFVSLTELVSCFLIQPTLTTKGTHNSNNYPSWSDWGQWECHNERYHVNCVLYRYRHCSNGQAEDCEKSGGKSYEMNVCDDRCRSHVSGTDNSNTYPSWSDWGPWECHNESYHATCVLYRYRRCSKGQEVDCEKSGGKSYQIKLCDNSCAPKTTQLSVPTRSSVPSFRSSTQTPSFISMVTMTALTSAKPTSVINPFITDNSNNNPSWSDWGQWECHNEQIACVMYRSRNCSDRIEEDCMRSGSKSFQINPCDGSCSKATTSLSVQTASSVSSLRNTSQTSSLISMVAMTSLTSAKSASVITPFTKSPVAQTSPTSAVPVYWLDWTGWNCKDTFGLCLMSNTRNCSTFNIDDCENQLGGNHYEVHTCRKEICPAKWLSWGAWRCKMGYNGSCNMTRSRECSTGSTEACGSTFSMTLPCEKQVCPEKFELQESGQCRGYNATYCTDASTCGIITDPKHLICQFKDTAINDCPKACGCCEEESHWLEWSDWQCHKMQNNTCRMKRSRACSTNNTRDCKGIARLEAACTDSICQSAHHTLPVYSAISSTTIEPISMLTTVKTPTRLTTSDLLSTTSTASAQWSTWFEGQCSVSCGSGTAARLRHCSTGHDEDCIGRPFETIHCTATACNV